MPFLGIGLRGSLTGLLQNSYPKKASQDGLFSLYKRPGSSPQKNMDEIQKELQQEEELLKSSKEDELRVKIIEKYGLDEVEHETLIENLVKDRLEDQKRFGEVVGQKRKWREEAQKKPSEPSKKESIDPDELLKKATEVVEQKFEQRDLNDLGLPDELKAEVQKVAKAQGISVRQAANDPYIQFKKDAWEKEQKTNEAAISRNNKTAATTIFDLDRPPKLDSNVDYSTPEGKKVLEKFQQDNAKWLQTASKQ